MPLTASRRAGSVILALAALAGLAAAPLAIAPAVASPAVVDTPVEVAVVVPVTARSVEPGLLDADSLGILTSPAGALTRELDEVLATSATIALDPMIPASIRLLGSAAPESATEWLDRLAAAPNEVFLLAYADADLSAFARAGALDLAAPLGFGFALDPAAFGPAATPTPTASDDPTPTPTPDDESPPPPPTTEELLAWDRQLEPVAWPAEGTAIAADVAAYEEAGYKAVLLNSANVSETATALTDLGGMPGLVSDSAASELLRQASTSIDEAAREQAIERLGATLDGLAAAHPGRSVVLTLGRSASFSIFGFRETMAALGARESSRLVGLSDVLSGVAEPASVVDGASPGDVGRAPELAAADRAENAFATILADPLALTAPRRLALLSLLAVQGVDDADWTTRAQQHLTDSAGILNAVTIVDGDDLFVTSGNTSVPIRVANGLDFAVTVRLEARPLRPLIRIESPAEVTIEPGSSKTVRLDAQAITNGQVTVQVALSSPGTGVQIGTPRSLRVDLQAQWETVGLIVGAVVALIFAAGIVRNVVMRRRKSARERAEDDRGDVKRDDVEAAG